MTEDHDTNATNDYLAKAIFPPEHADLIRRLTMEEQIEKNGHLDFEALYRRDSALSLAVDRDKRNAIARRVAILSIFATILGILLKWLAF